MRPLRSTAITIETLIHEADDIQRAATAFGNPSAAIAAVVTKAKPASRWTDRNENKNTTLNYAISDELPTEEHWAAQQAGRTLD